jgi:opacity protein-like surface antigen
MTVMILAGLLFTNAAWAKIGFMGIGGRVGYVKPEDPIDGTFGVGVVADLGTIVPAVGLEAAVDYWTKGYDASFMGSDAEWTYNDLMISATAKYMIPTQGSVMPYIGGGLALHMFSWEYTCSYYYDDYFMEDLIEETCDDSETDIGFHAVGGIKTALSPNLHGGIEGRYAIADPDHFGIFALITYVVGQ